MESQVNESVADYSIWKFKGYDEVIDQWPLMSTPYPVILIFIAYLLFVLKLGPEYMKKRQPFSLNNILLLYNVLQVAVSVYVFLYGSRILLTKGLFNTVCNLDKENLQPLAIGMYYYATAKISELLDTVFFVLRKKDNQITFLHVYHHALMLVVSWYTLKYEPTYTIVFLGTINCLVHVVMYSYYALSTFPALSKYLWWKKYITTMQLIQFGLIMLQVTADTYITGCPSSTFLLSLIFVNLFLMIYLFSDFYVKAYIKNRNNVNKDKRGTKEAKIQKSEVKSFGDIISNNSEIHEKSL